MKGSEKWVKRDIIPKPEMNYHILVYVTTLLLVHVHAKLLQLCPNLCDPARLLCPWDSPGKNTRVDCHILFQRVFPTQG